MLLFAAHDPGAKNHLRPIYEHARSVATTTEFIDLSALDPLEENQAFTVLRTIHPTLVICGCSINQFEWALIRASRRLGVPAVMIVDVGVGPKLDGIPQTDFPDRFFVTNPGCVGELMERGAHPDTVLITGSVHLEQRSDFKVTGLDVAQHYGITPNENIVPFFSSAIDFVDEAVMSLAMLLPETSIDRPQIIVRPHPRSSAMEIAQLKAACNKFNFVHLDVTQYIDTPSLLAASKLSLSMASSVSLESLVLKIPSAFFQIGWDFAELEPLFRNVVTVPKIRSADDLQQFISTVLDGRHTLNSKNVENCVGALERTWQAIIELQR